MKYHWTYESWGNANAPENADEIIDQANELIDLYARDHDEEETADYSARLWDAYCERGKILAYDINIDSRGCVAPMYYGWAEKVNRLSFVPWDLDNYVVVGKYRIHKSDMEKRAVRRFLELAKQQGKLF